jgi:hypothetical protein
VVHIYNRILFSHKEKWNYVICMRVAETGDHHVSKQRWERQILQGFAHMQNVVLKNMTQLGGLFMEREPGKGSRVNAIHYLCMK